MDDLGTDSGSEYDDEENDDEDDGDGDEGAVSFDTERFMSILMNTLGKLLLCAPPRPEIISWIGPSENNAKPSERPPQEHFSDMMEQMDQEIATHEKINASFTHKAEVLDEEPEEAEDEHAPVDIQLNLVKNVLESFKSQQGLPGPAGNILGQFGIVLPTDNEEDEHE